jgi:D-alanyl-D-alanine carboxypeptidase/D-alanyl-D-alanine-endopeptidase (penicillin-binding protein 4)
MHTFRLRTHRWTLLILVGLLLAAASSAVAERPPENVDAGESLRTIERSSGEAEDVGTTGPRRSLPPTTAVSKEELGSLQTRLHAIVSQRIGSEARVGAYVVDTSTGQVLYARNAEDGFNPASNVKLITGAAVLDILGPERTLATRIYGDPNEEGVVDGPLYLVGEGDAFLLWEDVLRWAAQLKVQGVQRVSGGIVVDDSAFDGAYLPPAFEQKDEDASYRSPIGAVSVNFNAITVVVTPTQAGEQPDVRLAPPNDHVKVVNRATTVDTAGESIRFSSDPDGEGGTRIVVDGAIGSRASSTKERLRIDNPPGFAGAVLRRSLEMVGIEVDGEVRAGERPDGAGEVLVRHASQPLSYIVQAMNKWSNNFMAEQLLRVLGRGDNTPSTWERARDAVRGFLKTAGIDPANLVLKNGSGLYDGNEISPRQFVHLLTYMLDHSASPEFVSSLAVAGRDGTLADRMEGPSTRGRVRAKTGTLNGVSALSGYVETASGRQLAFSIILNETEKRAWRYRPAQDAFVKTLAELGDE